jgi:hypothetical protein
LRASVFAQPCVANARADPYNRREFPAAVARTQKTIIPDEPRASSAWSTVVLMVSSVGAFGLISLFLANNHRWTDQLLAHLPSPAGSLANDGIVAEQLRMTGIHTEHMTLSDRSSALLFSATLVNDSSIPVRGIRLAIDGWRDGNLVATSHGTCGKNVSVRLLKRLSRDEVSALMQLATEAEILAPGARTECQVALTQLRTEVEEVSYRVESAEPDAGHPPADSAADSTATPDPDRASDPLPAG